MTSLSVQVMAHPTRRVLVSGLVRRLDIGPEHVTWDQRGDRWDTGRRAMLAAASRGASWTAVIQDDAIVCRDLIVGLSRALHHLPGQVIVSPFVGTKSRCCAKWFDRASVEAERVGASWLQTNALMWGLMIIVPTSTVASMVAWGDRWRRQPDYGTRVGKYYLDRGYTTRYTWPSLVDHADVPSLIDNPSGRCAYRFIGEDASALDLDWSGPVIDVPMPAG